MTLDIKLFCLPFAGGSSYAYNGFKECRTQGITVVPIELPGRGKRINEKLLTTMGAMVDDVMDHLASDLSSPYAIYGHSMGTLIGYLVAKEIIRRNLPQPLHLFFSGSAGPSFDDGAPKRHLLPEVEFIAELKRLGGIPEELYQSPEIMEFFEPILRADFQVVETYEYVSAPPFDIPISCMIGLQEKISVQDATTWQLETTSKVTIRQFPGNHFFIFDHEEVIMQLVKRTLFIQESVPR